MTRWERVWDAWPRRFAPTDYFRQVGKTVNGVPLSTDQLRAIADDIVDQLQLCPSDVLLDLCCGNGLLTREIATRCARVVAVDLSAPLIDVARTHHAADNVEYVLLAAQGLEELVPVDQAFTKIVMYDALQFFEMEDVGPLLAAIMAVSSRDRRIFIGGIPARSQQRRFYDTPLKRVQRLYYRASGRDLLGKWWTEQELQHAADTAGLSAAFRAQPAILYNSHFRFDVTLT